MYKLDTRQPSRNSEAAPERPPQKGNMGIFPKQRVAHTRTHRQVPHPHKGPCLRVSGSVERKKRSAMLDVLST